MCRWKEAFQRWVWDWKTTGAIMKALHAFVPTNNKRGAGIKSGLTQAFVTARQVDISRWRRSPRLLKIWKNKWQIKSPLEFIAASTSSIAICAFLNMHIPLHSLCGGSLVNLANLHVAGHTNMALQFPPKPLRLWNRLTHSLNKLR